MEFARVTTTILILPVAPSFDLLFTLASISIPLASLQDYVKHLASLQGYVKHRVHRNNKGNVVGMARHPNNT